MMKRLIAIFPTLLLVGAAAPITAAAVMPTLIPTRLRCEYRTDPLGIDLAHPLLDWILEPTDPKARNLAQSGYEILVASSPDLLEKDQGDLWDSGKVDTDRMNQLPYAGKPLLSSESVWWKVKVWDQSGSPSAWSTSARWTTGLLEEKDWLGAKWIAAPKADQPNDPMRAKASYETALLRKQFTVKPNLRRAIVHVCGVGQYEMTLNGAKVGHDLLTPGWTLYNKSCLYDTYDVTDAVKPGANAVGIFLGNGFFNSHRGRYIKLSTSFGPIQAIAALELDYGDGSIEHLVTDQTWKTASGPITFSSIYGGEDYDARLVTDGWDKPAFNDSAWESAGTTDGPGGTLRGLSAAGPPIRAFDVLTPVTKQVLRPGVIVYDLGQNAAIMLRIKVEGAAGASVKVTPSELVKTSGDISDTMCGGKSFWTYTLSGNGEETYFSHFYYRGGRYLKVELVPATAGGELPIVHSIEGDTLHADAPAVGQFTCSNDLFNKIYKLIRWAQVNNMVSVMTDCPTREKLGWLEEDHLNGPALRYNFDLAPLMTKMVCDMADSQRASGLVTSTAPDYFQRPETDKFVNPPEWGSACIVVPWQQYQFDGDVELLSRSYDMMTKYVAFLGSRANGDIVNFGLGDWYDNAGFGTARLTPIALTATAFYYEDAMLLSQIATLMGKKEDAGTYHKLATQILLSFNQKFFNASANSYATGSQASNAVPLALDMVDPAAREGVLANLVKDFQEKQTTVGEVCLESLLNALSDGGRSDLIYNTYNSDQSGYGLQIKLGKTSMTEGWNGGSSQDHFMFGELNEWLFTHLAGIQCDPQAPAFRKIIIAPSVAGDLTEVKASYDSISGKIVSQWKVDGPTLILNVEIPPNTSALIRIPCGNPASVREDGLPASRVSGIRLARMIDGCAEYLVGSGDYTFTANK